MSKIRFVGLDVHADTIAVAVAEPGQEIRSISKMQLQPHLQLPRAGRPVILLALVQ
jgi:hypothetical protein